MNRPRTLLTSILRPAARLLDRRLTKAVAVAITTAAGVAGLGYGVDEGWEVTHAGAAATPAPPVATGAADFPRGRAIAVWPGPATAAASPAGESMGDATRTCRRSTARHVATRASECSLWEVSGPVNFVISSPGPVLPALARAGWQPARGDWLVAQGFLDNHAGCAAGWRDSREQLELRLGPTSRRHLKLIHVDCPPGGVTTLFGDAHTDGYDMRRCGGDRTMDVDIARDALVQSLQRRANVSVTYRRTRAQGAQYRAGCGQMVATDGMVAYIRIEPGSG